MPKITQHKTLYKQHGFTLIEVLITVTLAGIIFAIAIPSYTLVKTNNTLASSINELSMGLLSARSEASKRNRSVSVCKSNNSTDTTPTCSTIATDFWNNGWIAFVDLDGDGDFESGDTIVRVGNPLPNGYVIKGSANFVNKVTYIATGEVKQTGGFVLCKDNNTSHARALRLSLTGRIKIQDKSTPIATCTPA